MKKLSQKTLDSGRILPVKSKNKKTGTKEWAVHNKNIYIGCRRRCRYCYRAYDDTVRWKKAMDYKTLQPRHMTEKEWKEMKFDPDAFNERPRKMKGRIFCFSGHDIFLETIDKTIKYLKRWLEAGNEILIVTKPILECIKRLCEELEPYKDQITFRFTIGSYNDDNLKFWDGGDKAPLFEERIKSLMYAFHRGFKTSVSCEPFFDNKIVDLFHMLKPYVTDSIWIGKMNQIDSRVDTTRWDKNDLAYLQEVQDCQTDSQIRIIYERLKDEPKIRWKESIKQVIGLPEEEIG